MSALARQDKRQSCGVRSVLPSSQNYLPKPLLQSADCVFHGLRRCRDVSLKPNLISALLLIVVDYC